MSLSRRERREYAKRLGILAKKESYEQMMERFRRSSAAGEHLHTHHLQEVKNQQLEKDSITFLESSQEPKGTEDEGINPFVFLGKK
jgi:endonuclease IV